MGLPRVVTSEAQSRSRPLPRLRKAETSPDTSFFRLIPLMSSKPSAIKDPILAPMFLTFIFNLPVQPCAKCLWSGSARTDGEEMSFHGNRTCQQSGERLAQTNTGSVGQLPSSANFVQRRLVFGPAEVGHFHDHLRPCPVHSRQLERRADAADTWRAASGIAT